MSAYPKQLLKILISMDLYQVKPRGWTQFHAEVQLETFHYVAEMLGGSAKEKPFSKPYKNREWQ